MKRDKVDLAARPYDCPSETFISVVGGKWKLRILYYIHHQLAVRPGELQRLLAPISRAVLTQQLKELEEDGVVQRTVYAEVPPRVDYSLTDFGRTLTPIIQQMSVWGTENQQKVNANRR